MKQAEQLSLPLFKISNTTHLTLLDIDYELNPILTQLIENVSEIDRDASDYVIRYIIDNEFEFGTEVSNEHDKLSSFFIWNSTPQGHKYWEDIANKLDNKYGNPKLRICKPDIEHQMELDDLYEQ